MSSALVDYKRALELRVREIMPYDVPFVGTHIGRFESREVAEYAVKAPAVILSPFGVSVVPVGGNMRAKFDYAAYVLTKSNSVTARGEIALAIVEALLNLLPVEGFATGGSPTEPISAANLYDGKIDDMGVALWAIRWTAPVMLTPQDLSDADDFLRLFHEYDLGGASDYTFPAQTEITTHPGYFPPE